MKHAQQDKIPTVQIIKKSRELQGAGDTDKREELIKSAEDSLVGVVREFDRAFEILEKYPKTVSIFGSARLTEENPSYVDARNVAGILADQGFAVVTGGGGGIMEAANRGAFEAGGGSIGLNIILPNEQKLNEYTTDNFAFEHFFARKVALTLEASAYVFFAGGYGTLDELFEITTLIQTGDIDRRPIILFGSEFWGPLLDFIKNTLVDKFQTISNEDNDLFIVIDEYEQIISLLLK